MPPQLLHLIRTWQKQLAIDLIQHDPTLTDLELIQITQRWILILVCLWLCEQLNIFPAKQMQALLEKPQLQQMLIQQWQRIGGEEPLFNKLLNRPMDQNLLQSFIRGLIDLPSQSSEPLSVALLGLIHETFSEQTITRTADRQIELIRNRHSKKTGGVYYTPIAIVNYIVENTVGQWLQQGAKQGLQQESEQGTTPTFIPPTCRILDPACGGGIFLIAAYEYLLDWHLQYYIACFSSDINPAKSGLLCWKNHQWQLTFAERQRILEHCIYGVDLDPQAVAVTQLSLRLKLLESGPDIDAIPSTKLHQTIQCGNALIGSDFQNRVSVDRHSHDLIYEFDWSQAFPEVRQAGGFDIVIGNPPYIDSEWMTQYLPAWRQYCVKHYQTASGNWDVFCLFIERAVQLCRSQGFTSFVVPNKLASADYAAKTRQFLQQQTQLLVIRDYSQVNSPFAAAVYPLVYVAQKKVPDAQFIGCYEVMQDMSRTESQCHAGLFHISADANWLISSCPDYMQLMSYLQSTFPSLADCSEITGAATVAEAYQLQSWLQDQAIPSPEDFKVVNSGTIDRYAFLWGQKPMRYLGQRYYYPILTAAQVKQLPLNRQRQACEPKLIVAGMSRRLECAMDADGAIMAGKSTVVIRSTATSLLDRRYLLGLLNSQLIHFYFATRFVGNRLNGGFFRVGPPQLRLIPIPSIDQMTRTERMRYDQLIDLVSQRQSLQPLFLHSRTSASVDLPPHQFVEQEIDRLVYQLYRLSDRQIAAIEQWIRSQDPTASDS